MAGDKRIRNLTQPVTPLQLDSFLAVDRPGLLEAERRTILEIVNLIASSGPKQNLEDGSTFPDNASGQNGDFYMKYDSSPAFVHFLQKVAGVWVEKAGWAIGGTSAGVPSREYLFSIEVGSLNTISNLFCTGTERPVSIFISEVLVDGVVVSPAKTLDIAEFTDNVLYANFPSEGVYNGSVIIMGTPADLPDADPPSSGIVASNPNTFTFTPAEEPSTD